MLPKFAQTSRMSLLLIIGICCSNTRLIGDDSVAMLRFNKDIRPILSNACFRCHGYDAKTREADFRLDNEQGATAVRPSGSAGIVPGKLDASLVWSRINSTDPDEVMPPPSANHQLSSAEKQTIAKWIEQGAAYEKHWSFEPIREPAIPNETSSSAIDRFIDQQLSTMQLRAQGAAEPTTIVRRLSFTLTGLPPSLEDTHQFATDPSDAAYEKLVDRYLASSSYGVEMARHWLDVARYGDTHGLHLDNERQAWMYRDWVVDAFNANQPFSQFTIDQIAGDLLPNPSTSQLVATGFNRCNVTTSEGGAIDDEFLFRYAVDRTSTTIQAWLGLTGGCAVCHDHKYDPLSTREFYSMYAFFYSAADPAMDGNVDTTSPFIKVPAGNQQVELQRARATESQLLSQLTQLGKEAKQLSLDTPTDGPYTQVWLDDEIPVGATQRNTSRNEPRWTEADVRVPMGKRALRQSFGDKYEQVITGGIVPRWIPVDGQLRAWVQIDPYSPPKAIFIDIATDAGSKRWVWANDKEMARRVDSNADRVVSSLPLANEWTELSIPLADLSVGSVVREIKLGQFGGNCCWDGVTCTGKMRAEDNLRRDATAWWSKRKGTDTALAEGDVPSSLTMFRSVYYRRERLGSQLESNEP
jgi:hypothetical protein